MPDDDALTTAGSLSAPRRLRTAITAVFVVHGMLFASWTAHIPHVKAHLGMNDGELGLALVGAPVGSVAAMIAATWLLPRLGSRRTVQIGLVGYCSAGPLVGLTGSLSTLLAALFVWGAFQGTLDVAMNTQAISVERTSRRVLMSGLHGSWSIGSFAGAGIGALAVAAGVSLSLQLLIVGSIALLVVGLLTARLLPAAFERPEAERVPADERGVGRLSQRPASRWSGGMSALCMIAFASMLCEGATANWAAVYLSGPLHAHGIVPGLGYASFSLAMVTVRLLGNRMLRRFGYNQALPVLATTATLGLTIALVVGHPVVSLFGFSCLGIGLGAVVPAVFSAAGRIPGVQPATAIATAAACGWAGFVCGPPLIGQLAAWTSLPTALGVLPILTASIVVGTRTSRALRTNPREVHGLADRLDRVPGG